MAPSKSADREARQARERLRRFNARQEVHKQRVSRRKRDNVLAVIGVVVIAALATLTQVVFFTAGPGAPEPKPEPSASATPEPQQNVGDIPDPSLSEFRTWTGELVLGDVPLAFELDGAAAPQTVAAFVKQVQDGYFVDKTCHRLTDAAVKLIQCGSVDGTGAGDPDFRFGPIENAPKDGVYPAGTIAMARASGDAYSQGHQFFIMYEDGSLPEDMAGGYTVFGKVTDGLDRFIEQIASGGVQPGGPGGDHDGAPVVPTTITSVSVQ